MRHHFAAGFCLLLAAAGSVRGAAETITYSDGKLSNGIVAVEFGNGGMFSVRDARSGETLLADARFGLPMGLRGTVENTSVENLRDELGNGRRVTLEVKVTGELRHQTAVRRLFSYTLHEGSPALVCGFGVRTPNYLSLRVREGRPLAGGRLFGGKTLNLPMTLNGAAGADKTLVTEGLSRSAPNSLMVTGLIDGQRRSAVWGGLRYKEFGAYAVLDDGSPAIYSEDPVGRLVDEDQTWMAADSFYIDVFTRDPFEALERYGAAMRLANHADPNVYDFPVLCGWSVGHISKLPNVNNSARLIDELQAANRCGLTKYTKAALRLEPDKYHFDTEQGWWDDAHMRTFKHLVEPYDSIAKWSEAMNAANGIPYIYMQLGMPSDDFAREHPGWMLFNDASEVDKSTPGKNLKYRHPHHQPYVTYDYTDKGFSEHFSGCVAQVAQGRHPWSEGGLSRDGVASGRWLRRPPRHHQFRIPPRLRVAARGIRKGRLHRRAQPRRVRAAMPGYDRRTGGYPALWGDSNGYSIRQ